MNEEIEEKLSALVDGELSDDEGRAVRALASASPELISHLAFLERLREATLDGPLVPMPAGLSERIAAATYARPTLWSRISAALAPAPVRYAMGGLALSGVAAIGWLSLRPAPAPPSAPVPDRVAIAPSPAPPSPVKDFIGAKPKTAVPPAAKAPQVALAPAPAMKMEAAVPSPSIEPPVPIVGPKPPVLPFTQATAARPRAAAKSLAARVSPASSSPKQRKPSVKSLAPARLADPIAGSVTVADASETPDFASATPREIKPPSEAETVAAQPQSSGVVSGGMTSAAAHGDPSDSGAQESVKITLANLPLEKSGAMVGKGSAKSASGSRMSLVNDGGPR